MHVFICCASCQPAMAVRARVRAPRAGRAAALAGREAKLGAEHPETLTSVNSLALLLKALGPRASCRRPSN